MTQTVIIQIFPMTTTYLLSSRICQSNDVTLSLVNYADILTETIGNLKGGEFVWTAKGKDGINWSYTNMCPVDVVIQSVTETVRTSIYCYL